MTFEALKARPAPSPASLAAASARAERLPATRSECALGGQFIGELHLLTEAVNAYVASRRN